MEVIDKCNYISDICTFRSREVKLLAEKQKRCKEDSRGINDLLYIDRAVIKEVKSRNKYLVMAWIDYNKAYDMVQHAQIIECLNLFEVAENIKSLLGNNMEK